MPSPLEIAAKQREDRKLRQAGFNPDGTRIEGLDDDDTNPNPNLNPDDDDDKGIKPPIKSAREIELETQLAAMQGRVGPSQQQADEYRRLLDIEQTARRNENKQRDEEIKALREDLEKRNTSINIEEILTEEERADLDPNMLKTVAKLADAIAQRRAPKVDTRAETLRILAERDAQNVVDYRQRVLTDPTRGLHQLGTLAYDPAFVAWSEDEDNDVNSVVTSLLNAKSTEEVDRYARIVAKRIVKFKEHKAAPPQPADTRPALGSHMRREAAPKLTEEQVNQKLAQAKQLARSSSPADQKKAKELLAEIS